MRFRAVLRLLRIVIMFRKMNEMRKINAQFNKGRALFDIKTTADQVLKFIEQLQGLRWIKKNKFLNIEIEWLKEVILNNWLYEDFVINSNNAEANEWISQFSRPQNEVFSPDVLFTPIHNPKRRMRLSRIIPIHSMELLSKFECLYKVDQLEFDIF